MPNLLRGGTACLLAAALCRIAAASAVQTYSFAATAFVEDPTGTWVYAADPANNACK
jgi:hypothetical protein